MSEIKKFWQFLKKDTWQSWFVSLILAVVLIKFLFFPFLSLVTGSSLPLVVVESCSMYHESKFDSWWEKNSEWYEGKNITREDFENYPIKGGLNKGDIVFIVGRGGYNEGDVIVFNANRKYPLIHRIVGSEPINTKGDHNPDQIDIEKSVSEDEIIGKAFFKVPYIGWVKLVFFEPFKPISGRGLCH